MSDPLSDFIFQVPSVQRALQAIVEDFASRRSVLVLLPKGVDPGRLSFALRKAIIQRDFWVRDVYLPRLRHDLPPVVALAEELAVSFPTPETPRTITNLFQSGALPETVQLTGFDELSSPARDRWARLIAQWVQASHSAADRGITPAVLCLIAPLLAFPTAVPSSDIYLAIHWWWGFPSMLEMQMLCRNRVENSRKDPVALWREYVLSAVAGNDLNLLIDLWEVLHLDGDEFVEHLRGFAERRGWTRDMLHESGAPAFRPRNSHSQNGHPGHPPAAEWRALWANGAIEWTIEHGLELHIAAAALLGYKDEVRHRLWRGQSRLLLPALDQIRLTVCDYLTDRYGDDWPFRWFRPSSPEEATEVQRNPRACQWGHLWILLKQCLQLSAERRFLPLVSKARQIRNNITHYRPVTFAEFQSLSREMERLYPASRFV